MELAGSLAAGETWRPMEDAAQTHVLHSASQLFGAIKKSLQRCARFVSRGEAMLRLMAAFQARRARHAASAVCTACLLWHVAPVCLARRRTQAVPSLCIASCSRPPARPASVGLSRKPSGPASSACCACPRRPSGGHWQHLAPEQALRPGRLRAARAALLRGAAGGAPAQDGLRQHHRQRGRGYHRLAHPPVRRRRAGGVHADRDRRVLPGDGGRASAQRHQDARRTAGRAGARAPQLCWCCCCSWMRKLWVRLVVLLGVRAG